MPFKYFFIFTFKVSVIPWIGFPTISNLDSGFYKYLNLQKEFYFYKKKNTNRFIIFAFY